MLPQSTVDWFRREREAGRMPKSLPQGGAYDAMPRSLRKAARDQGEELPAAQARQLDALSDDSAGQVFRHLQKRFGDVKPSDHDDWEDDPAGRGGRR